MATGKTKKTKAKTARQTVQKKAATAKSKPKTSAGNSRKLVKAKVKAKAVKVAKANQAAKAKQPPKKQAPLTKAKAVVKAAPKAGTKVTVPPTAQVAGKVDPKVAAKATRAKGAKAQASAAAKVMVKDERIYSHPTMCLHCHLIVEMFHERGADPVKGAWQCPRCGHKYLFSHWKIKRQARGKSEAA